MIQRTSKSRYGRLAEYIAAAQENGEKLHSLWMEKCDARTDLEDLALAIIEVEATQKLNNRSNSDKSYHLLISFRKEDKIPCADDLKEIERAFAKALGFVDHQRIIGCHQNTDNFHMHVAYNKVHPDTLAIHIPFGDFKKLGKACHEVEKKYGLTLEHDPEVLKERENTKAQDYETQTWEESFSTYVKGHKNDITKILKQSSSWQEFHDKNNEYSIRFKTRGNGLVIQNTKDKQQIKASTLGREFSKKSIEEKLGLFQAYQRSKVLNQAKPKTKDEYKKSPITKHPKTIRYWRRYMGVKNSKDSLTRKAFKSWKEFLQTEALNDPLAMAIIHYQKQIVNAGLSPIDKFTKKLNALSRND